MSIAGFILISLSTIVISCPMLPTIDTNSIIRIEVGAKVFLIKYFEASKNGDAKTASSLIDYDEWAKDMNLQGDSKKQWIDMHKGSLQEDYDMQKTDGSTKEYKILSSELKGDEAIFKVSQQRAAGVYVWEVRLVRKQVGEINTSRRWRIKGFYLKEVGGGEGQIFQIMN
jgi:hypothetical protein